MYNDNLEERYLLSMNRIAEIKTQYDAGELKIPGSFHVYFGEVAAFILHMDMLGRRLEQKEKQERSLEELQAENRALYEDILGENYERSFANPAAAVELLGAGYGQLLSFLYVEIRSMIVYVYEKKKFDITILCELFLEIFCLFSQEEEEGIPSCESIREAIYWHVSDYSDILIEQRVAAQLDRNENFAVKLIEKADLNDIRYLYGYGEYVTENEIRTAQYLNCLPEEAIETMAAVFTEGFRKGFVLGNKDMSKKKIVNIRYCLGFERLVKKEMEQFAKMGLQTTLYRSAAHTINKRMHHRVGYYGAIPNKQMEYDHRFDNSLYLDKDFVERKLGALRTAYEKYKAQAAVFAGPAVMEVFGQTPFEPVNKPQALSLDAKQQKLSVKYDNESGRIINEYIPGKERSFTIIAYPVPEIGEDYEAVFAETVKMNTLDYEVYKNIQQALIDALDGSSHVRVRGQKGNLTDITVAIQKLENPAKETAFENCLADVNIPLGEVFTSPVLTGTDGKIHVSEVYLHELRFKNLWLDFKDGFVSDYGCDNFEEEEKNRAYIRENVLYNHKTLPMGEFAIGTNTTAYVMANRYDIVYKLPILIVEKMGPHFAVGDTCYSWSEDTPVYNPDGKEIVARDNEVSVLRKTDVAKAYFNCHTDITIPYDEIGEITALKPDGQEIPILFEGRFVLDKTRELNCPFEE